MVGQRRDRLKPFLTQVALMTTNCVMHALVFKQQKLIRKLLVANSACSLLGVSCRVYLRFMLGQTLDVMKPFFAQVTRITVIGTVHAMVFAQQKLTREFLAANFAHLISAFLIRRQSVMADTGIFSQ